MCKLLAFLCALTLTVSSANTARILCAIGIPSYSHQVFFQPLWRELAIRGHDVVVITAHPTHEKLPNFKEVDVHETYKHFKLAMDEMVNSTILELFFKNRLAENVIHLMNQTVGLPQVQEIINNKTEHFDLLILEHYFTPLYALKKIYNCPMIGVMSFDATPVSHRIMGNAVHSVLYPSGILPKPNNLTFFERIMALVFGNIFDVLLSLPLLRNAVDRIARESFGLTGQDIMESFESTDMLFLNTNPILVPVRPFTPSTISVAGLHMSKPKALPNELQNYLDKSTQGVIYFSLGTNIQSNLLSLQMRKVIIDTLSQLPYHVLYKYEDDIMPEKPDNVKLIKWVPQQDILRHKNVKLFITQGGIQSLEEAFYLNVPMIVIPFFGDQLPNAENIKQHGLGIYLDRHTLTTEDFKAAISEVIINPAYRKALEHYSSLVKDNPMKPLDRAVWWTEYVLRHKGASHLKGPTIPFYQYYYLDIILALLLFLLILLSLLVFMVKCLNKFGRNASKPKTKTN